MEKRCFQILLMGILMQSCKSKQEKILPLQEAITESVYASGIVKSINQYNVFSAVNGLVAAILVKEGDVVKKGDAIIKLVNTNALLNTQNAALSADYNSVNANAEKLNELKSNINFAKAKKDADALLLNRQQNLWNENIGTKNELEQRQLAYKSDVTAYEAATLRYTQLKKQINFQGSQSQRNLQIANAIKNDYTIKSDVDGKIYRIILKQGEMVNTINPVAVIGNAGIFITELQVDEYDISRIKLTQNILLSMDSYKGQVFEATVTKIDPIMNEKSKSFTIEAAFVKQPVTLYPNLTCEANIIIQQKAKAITIPRNYLLTGDSVIVEKGKKRKVITGLKDYQKVEIISGVTVNEYIYKPAL